jgi:ElaB/YqjD/DUF883 family membrane-anchored ribosome-binding protein
MDTSQVRDAIDDIRRLLDDPPGADQLAARASEVRARLRAALEHLDAATRAGRAEIAEVASAAQRTLQDELVEAERKIRDNPLGAIAVAAGVGLVLGLLVRRR